MSEASIILAAGRQTRFGEGVPKCLSKIGDGTVLSRLLQQIPKPHIVVISHLWNVDHRAYLRHLGCDYIYAEGSAIGHSVVSGLRALSEYRDVVYVVSADTYLPSGMNKMLVLDHEDALFDPYAWITIWCLKRGNQLPWAYGEACQDRVRHMISHGWSVKLVSTGGVNINTPEDLGRARRIHDSGKQS